ncbi:hypothetical protein FHX42_002509 [Saccharopolyspora lacisalsi]|uniref:Uncharacterized protein n=1 Tax=Halosaccharopolyspora lacisalsi TaxID=1000566 RepID=A0A839E2K2_9PSEU|nr:hypothetical protein [Halosaccharopolyspora lacisalsi]MBA8825158.1 hypothetical protein [Halosaccharopolyspora lacisalsi]
MSALVLFTLVVGATGAPYALPICLLGSCMFGLLHLLWLKVYRQRRDEE